MWKGDDSERGLGGSDMEGGREDKWSEGMGRGDGGFFLEGV